MMILMILFKKDTRILTSVSLLTAVHDDIDASMAGGVKYNL